MDDDLFKKLKKIQGKLIITSNKYVRFSSIISDILKKGLR